MLRLLMSLLIAVFLTAGSAAMADSASDSRNPSKQINDAVMTGQQMKAGADTNMTLMQTLTKNGRFSTFLTLMEAADMEEMLTKGQTGQFTMFVPSDAAFAKLPAGTVADLLKPENKERLQNILSYHVIPGKVMASDIAGKTVSPTTAQGQTITINATNTDAIKYGNAQVVATNLTASNGVAHVIDNVVMPKPKTPSASY